MQVDYVACTALINAYAKRSDANGALTWLRQMSDLRLKSLSSFAERQVSEFLTMQKHHREVARLAGMC